MNSGIVPIGARSILDAATSLFAYNGFESVSMASIAAQAGLSKACVFHHFESKEKLYLEVMKNASAGHAHYAEELYRRPGMSADKVRELIEFEIRDTLAHPQRMRLITREVSEKGHAGMRRHARRVFQRNFTAVVSLFEQGRTTGEFRQSIDPAAAATLLGGATYFFFACREALHEFSETSSLESPETYAQRIAWLILSGVLSEPRPHGSET